MDHGGTLPVFSGGTSLSVGWGLIKRFSEDIDFRVTMPAAETKSATERQRRNYRRVVTTAMTEAGFALMSEARRGNENRFFSADFSYPSSFPVGPSLRPHIQLEMTFESTVLAAIERPIQSLVSRARKQAPEVAAFPCIDPVEAAADKFSALAWRTCVRDRASKHDDPRIVRHVHDLAALEKIALASPEFKPLAQRAVAQDTGRGGGRAPAQASERFARMLDLLVADPLWAEEYDTFVRNVSFAAPDEIPSFADALAALRRLVASV